MSRPKKAARLWQRETGEWIILDAGKQKRTGYSGESGREAAETALQEYIGSKKPSRVGPAQPADITIGEVLELYADEVAPHVASPSGIGYAVLALSGFWGSLMCDAVKGSTCKAYGKWRMKPRTVQYVGKNGKKWSRTWKATTGTVRKDLGVLQAALNYAFKEGKLIYSPQVTLSDEGPSRMRFLTRSEAARLIWCAAPHIRRYIVIALATGTRDSAILGLRLQPSLTTGWIDAEKGIIYRAGAAEQQTKKRRGSVRAPVQLHGHIKRWAKLGGSHAVEWKGEPVDAIDTGFRAACRRAGLEDVTPHTLKHTAVTWFFQRGGSLEDASDWFDTTPATLMKYYRQHSPEYQERARAVMGRK